MVCKPASQRDAVWAYGSSGEEMLGATCSWVTGDGRWEAHSQLYLFWLSFIFGYLFLVPVAGDSTRGASQR